MESTYLLVQHVFFVLIASLLRFELLHPLRLLLDLVVVGCLLLDQTLDRGCEDLQLRAWRHGAGLFLFVQGMDVSYLAI